MAQGNWKLAGRSFAGLAVYFIVAFVSGPVSSAEDARLGALRGLALQLVNAARAEHKLPPLSLDAKLNQAAQSHAEDMLKRGYFAHGSPEGKTVADRFQAAGGSHWRLTAENIAKCQDCGPPATDGTVRMLQDGWMNSPEHRENILREGLEHFGFGIAASVSGGLYAVQTFSGPGVQKGAEDANGKALSLRAQAEAALAEVNKRRSKAGLQPLKLSEALTEAARTIASRPHPGEMASAKVKPLNEYLPESERPQWRSLAMLAGACGGCGAKPIAADVAVFIEEWLSKQAYAKMLLNADITHLGFAVNADGKGLKAAVSIAGRHR